MIESEQFISLDSSEVITSPRIFSSIANAT